MDEGYTNVTGHASINMYQSLSDTVDALKKHVSSLTKRVAALENELDREIRDLKSRLESRKY